MGGQTSQFEQTQRCEIYQIASDQWTELPRINKGLSNCSVIIAQTQKQESVAYNFGGVERTHETMNVSYTIERLFFAQVHKGWEVLSVSLPTNMCHFGCL